MGLYKSAALAAVSLSLVVASPVFAATNLLVNGSFETGSFSGWSLTGAGTYGVTIYDIAGSAWGYSPEDGSYFALLGPQYGDGYLSQTFSDTAGTTYQLTYWLGSDGGTPNDFGSSINGAPLQADTNLVSTGGGYDEYAYSFIGTGSDTLTFNFRNDPGYLALDNVSVAADVPEPAAWALMILGFGAVGAALRARRQTNGSLAAA